MEDRSIWTWFNWWRLVDSSGVDYSNKQFGRSQPGLGCESGDSERLEKAAGLSKCWWRLSWRQTVGHIKKHANRCGGGCANAALVCFERMSMIAKERDGNECRRLVTSKRQRPEMLVKWAKEKKTKKKRRPNYIYGFGHFYRPITVQKERRRRAKERKEERKEWRQRNKNKKKMKKKKEKKKKRLSKNEYCKRMRQWFVKKQRVERPWSGWWPDHWFVKIDGEKGLRHDQIEKTNERSLNDWLIDLW